MTDEAATRRALLDASSTASSPILRRPRVDPAPSAGPPDLAERVRELVDVARRSPTPSAGAAHFRGYEILRELGRGGMGQVMLARHLKLGRTVALKVLPRRLASGKARERFEREARAVARLEHR